MRAQSAIEFLITYSWAFLILGIFVATAAVLLFSTSQGPTTYVPESCYINPSLPCYEALMLTNSISSTFIVILQNNLGIGLYFTTTNSFLVIPSFYQNTTYGGNCLPQNAIAGSTIICNSTFSNFVPSVGSQLNPKFTINYKICSPTCANSIYNTTGDAMTVVAPYQAVIFKVQLLSTPVNGMIAIGGIKYPNGANVIFISGLPYNAYAIPPNSAYTFNSWITTGNVVLANNVQSTIVTTNGIGTLTATFH